MRFQVPQFIDIEDKIFGPMSWKQFLYVGAGIGSIFILFRLLPKFIAIILALPIAGLAVALAFFKYNGRPFIFTLESAFNFALKSRLYLWRKAENTPKARNTSVEYQKIMVPGLSGDKLKEINRVLENLPREAEEKQD